MLIQRTETTHHLNLGWLTKGDEQALCSAGLWLRRFTFRDLPEHRCSGRKTGCGRNSEHTGKARGERCVKDQSWDSGVGYRGRQRR